MQSGDVLAVHVIPKAGADRVEGWEEDAAGQKWLKVRVTSAPEDGKANKAVLVLLAKHFNLPKRALSVVSGAKSRYKRVKINLE